VHAALPRAHITVASVHVAPPWARNMVCMLHCHGLTSQWPVCMLRPHGHATWCACCTASGSQVPVSSPWLRVQGYMCIQYLFGEGLCECWWCCSGAWDLLGHHGHVCCCGL